VRASLPLVALAAALILEGAGGCSITRPTKPPIHRYQLGPASGAALAPDRLAVQLGAVTGATPFRDTGIAYQTSPYRLDSYTFSRWAGSPVEMVTQRLRHLVEPPPTETRGSRDARILDSRIVAFQEVDIGGGVSGLVEMDFCLRPIRPPSRPQWCQTFRRQTPASADSREAAVAAITTSFNGVIEELTAALDRQLQAPPAQTEHDNDESHPARRRLRVPDRM
jgi:hypothetical protein